MKNRFRKLAAILGAAALVMSQGGVISAHAEEPAPISVSEEIQGAQQLQWGEEAGKAIFYNPNESGKATFLINIYKDGNYLANISGRLKRNAAQGWLEFSYFDRITEYGSYTFRIYTFGSTDTLFENEVARADSGVWEYKQASKQLSTPEELSWSKDGILSCKLYSDPYFKQYAFEVYKPNGEIVDVTFSSSYIEEQYPDLIEYSDGYMKFKLNEYVLAKTGESVNSGYYVKVCAASTNKDEVGYSNWISVSFNDGTAPVTTSSPAKESDNRAACTHEYEWVTECDATAITNGEEIYQCKYCGDVKERMELANSAYAKFNKDAIQSIDKAPVNGTVTIKTDMWVSFYASVIDTLKSRPDVTVVLNYFYKGTRYTMTIPAGADLSALVDSEGYYGFRYLDAFFPGQEVK